ncbi:MAG: transglycosylase SLT domain-containing protein [Acidobacteria bacterium]|nr:transglycosylase SLT domain-containing protein [Acidobacteriota bacterium]
MEEAGASIAKENKIDTPPALYSKEPPNLTQSTQAMLRLTALETRLRKAEAQFEEGKKAYNQGSFEQARSHFNGAVDLLLEAPNQDEAGRQRLERRLEEMVEAIYRYDISGLGAAESPEKFVFESSPRDSILDMTFPVAPRVEGGVRSIIAATQSSLPIDAHESVFSAITNFSGDRGRKILEHNLRRSGKYRAMIQRVFNEEGVPGELMYVAVLESGFSPRAVSPASAVGMWQFMSPTARDFQLNISAFADDRMDPEKATRASAKYFKFLYNMFGDWNLALAAYNCGPGCVDRAIQRTGYADYWKLREMHALPRDTDQYVPVILAFIVMAKNPSLYGLDTLKYDDPIEYDTLDVAQHTHLELIAAACDKPVADLRDMNPALLKAVAPAGYQMRVPKGSLNKVVAAIDAVPADKRAGWKFHRVERGETVASIAKKYRMQQSSLTAANVSMSDDEPEAGDLLLVPASYVPETVVTSRSSNSRTAARGAKRSASAPAARRGTTKSKASTKPTSARSGGSSTATKSGVRTATKAPAPRNRRA